jgi:hypothetical protein
LTPEHRRIGVHRALVTVGIAREVLHGDHAPSYRIAWDDGHTTIYTPPAGALYAARHKAAPAR